MAFSPDKQKQRWERRFSSKWHRLIERKKSEYSQQEWNLWRYVQKCTHWRWRKFAKLSRICYDEAKGLTKWRTLAKVWRMFLYGRYGYPFSVAILAKWNLGEMANNRQCLNKNSNEMTTGPFWKWWFRRNWWKWRIWRTIAKLLLTKYQTHFWT